MKGNLLTSVKGFISSTSWKIEKHAPEIFLCVGIVSTIGSVVAAVKATPKANAILEDHKQQMEVVHKCSETGLSLDKETGKNVEYTKTDLKNDTISVYAKTGWKLMKLFTPTALLVGASIVSQICGYKVLSQRLAAASAAYAALATKFKEYRKRVAEKIGTEDEKKLCHGVKAKEITTTQLDENGNPVEGKDVVYIADDDDYTGIFSQFNRDGILNPNWYPDSDQNLTWLEMEEAYWDKVLKCRKGKPVTLNEVRERLGLGKTQKGQATGWVYAPDNPKHIGDNRISFGLDPIIRAYRNGEEMPDDNSFVLDFNVDGNILYAF